MARGGKRTYTRDANGRFASTPGGGLGAARKAARSRSGRTSTLGARTSLKKSRATLAGKDPADQRLSTALSARAQKGAVTRGNKGLKAAKVAARTQISRGMKGAISRPKRMASSSTKKAESKQPVATTPARQSPLRGVGPVVARNLSGFKGLPVQIRSRTQAAQAQREKARILGEVGRLAPGAYGPMDKRGSMRIKYNSNRQMNIIGGEDTVKNRQSISFSNQSALGDSSRMRTVKAKMANADNKAADLNRKRSELITGMTTKDFRRNSEANQRLKKIEKSISTFRKASDYLHNSLYSVSKSRPRRRKPKP